MGPGFLISLGQQWARKVRFLQSPIASGKQAETNIIDEIENRTSAFGRTRFLAPRPEEGTARGAAQELAADFTGQLNGDFTIAPGYQPYEPAVYYGRGDNDAPSSYRQLVENFSDEEDGGQAAAQSLLNWMEGNISFNALDVNEQIFAVITHFAETARGMSPHSSGLSQFLDQIASADDPREAGKLWGNITDYYEPALTYAQDTNGPAYQAESSEDGSGYDSASGTYGDDLADSALASEDGMAGTSDLTGLFHAATDEFTSGPTLDDLAHQASSAGDDAMVDNMIGAAEDSGEIAFL
ncbi:MAG: hypothetical protein MI974_19450 [Chitinophagales bacterium]|nr:hypothetical protein [Chitinophagales bacterium]